MFSDHTEDTNANEYQVFLAVLTVEHDVIAAMLLNTEHVDFALCILLYYAR